MKVLRTLILVIIISQFSSIYAQEILYSHSRDEVVANNNTQKKHDSKKTPKLQYGLNMGTSISTGYFGNSVNIFTEPELRYRLSPKWSISTGLLIMNRSISNLYTDNNKGRYNAVSSYLTASVTYNATEKLRISGEILYGMNKSPYSFGNNKNSQEYYLRFNAEYKINEKLTLGLEIINEKTNFSPFSALHYGNRFYY